MEIPRAQSLQPLLVTMALLALALQCLVQYTISIPSKALYDRLAFAARILSKVG